MRLGKMRKKMIGFIASIFDTTNRRTLKTQLVSLVEGVVFLFNMIAHYKKRITKLKQQVKRLNVEYAKLKEVSVNMMLTQIRYSELKEDANNGKSTDR